MAYFAAGGVGRVGGVWGGGEKKNGLRFELVTSADFSPTHKGSKALTSWDFNLLLAQFNLFLVHVLICILYCT
jgi:hypothetical protein